MAIRFLSDAPTAISGHLVLGVSGDASADLAPLGAEGERLAAWLTQRKWKGTAGKTLWAPPVLGADDLLLVGVGERTSSDLRAAAGKAGQAMRGQGAESVTVWIGGDANVAAHAFGIGNYAYQEFKPESQRTAPASQITVVGEGDAHRANAGKKWQDWCRDLVNGPPDTIFPASMAAKVQALASIPHVEVEVWDYERLLAENYVGVVAVGQGSARKPYVATVRYRPPGAKRHVAFVGKGVTFDTGGYSLKPSSGMQTMRCDMGGSATVLSATALAAELGVPLNIDCIVGLAENMVSSDAYLLSDILRYRNGVTVEIHNTDAEGRLVMADCLIQACESGAEVVIDAATLTGACLVALGDDLSGLFTDDDDLAQSLLDGAHAHDEGLWRLPLHAPYKEKLKSDYAQIKNVAGRAAGATTAALFLQHFVTDDVRWAHVDIAGPAFMDSSTNRYAAGGTGEMVHGFLGYLESI